VRPVHPGRQAVQRNADGSRKERQVQCSLRHSGSENLQCKFQSMQCENAERDPVRGPAPRPRNSTYRNEPRREAERREPRKQ